jgi:hypothetical protein
VISTDHDLLDLDCTGIERETGVARGLSSRATAAFGRLSASVNREVVIGLLQILGATGIGTAIVLLQLTDSLLPSDHRGSDALTIELRDLAVGAYRSFDGRTSRLYVVRTLSDGIRAFTVPLRAAKVAMPDSHWGRSVFDCTDFSPGLKNAPLRPDSLFRCRDADVPAWGIYQWRWDLDGRSAAQLPQTHVGDMARVTVVTSGPVIRIRGWDIRW